MIRRFADVARLSRSSVARCLEKVRRRITAVGVPSLLLMAILAGAAASTAGAQRIRGRVLLPDSITSAVGVVVIAVDERGATIARARTSSAGFILSLPAAGRFVLQALRIGYAPTVTAAIEVAQKAEVSVQLVLSARALELAKIEVRTKDECGLVGLESTLVAELWGQARTALNATVVSMADGRLRSRVVRIDGERDADGTRVAVDSTVPKEYVIGGMTSDTPDDFLLDSGFVRVDGEGSFAYDVPSAGAVLADRFLARHCFHAEPSPTSGSDWVGLAFRPIDSDLSRADIAGVLWIQRATGELRQLDFRYVNMPRRKVQACATRVPGIGTLCGEFDSGGDGSGSVAFRQLDGGEWFASHWTLNTGVVAGSFREVFRVRGAGRTEERCYGGSKCARVSAVRPRFGMLQFAVASVTRDGAELYRDAAAERVVMSAAERSAGKRPMSVIGTVVATDGQPVRGAVVSFDTVSRARVADERGAFQIDALRSAPFIAVRVSAPGYDGKQFILTPKSGEPTIRVEFVLAASASPAR